MSRQQFETEEDRKRQAAILEAIRPYFPGTLVHVPTVRNVVREDAQWRQDGALRARLELKHKGSHRWPLWIKVWQYKLLCQPPMGIMVWWLEREQQMLLHRVIPGYPYPPQVAFRGEAIVRDDQDRAEEAVGVPRHLCLSPEEFEWRLGEDEAVARFGF